MDSFSDGFAGDGVAAVVEVLAAAGYAPRFLERPACCGLTWISTGQLDGARRQLRAALDVLHPVVAAGHAGGRAGAVVHRGLAERCRRAAARMIRGSPRSRPGSSPWPSCWPGPTAGRRPDLSGVEIVAQPHCHHASVLGWQADAALLNATGATVTTVGGCCGLAGNFGVEQGHYEVSVKMAEHDLLPAVRAHPDAMVLADGFSCRTQLAELAGRQRRSRWPSCSPATGANVQILGSGSVGRARPGVRSRRPSSGPRRGGVRRRPAGRVRPRSSSRNSDQ